METISSRKNPIIVHMKKLGASADYRREHREFLCDGAKLFEEAVKWGVQITAILISGEMCPPDVPNAKIIKVPEDILDAVSPLKSAQSLLFSCRVPAADEEKPIGDKHILLEGIQDPGNMGAIIRSANAFNMDSVMLLGNCADPYNPKAVRAAMGAIFRQRIIRIDYDGLAALKAKGLKLYAADLGKPSIDLRGADLANCVVCIGSEGQGISEKLIAIGAERLKIPMNPACESLNAAAAAAVIMWEMNS